MEILHTVNHSTFQSVQTVAFIQQLKAVAFINVIILVVVFIVVVCAVVVFVFMFFVMVVFVMAAYVGLLNLSKCANII